MYVIRIDGVSDGTRFVQKVEGSHEPICYFGLRQYKRGRRAGERSKKRSDVAKVLDRFTAQLALIHVPNTIELSPSAALDVERISHCRPSWFLDQGEAKQKRLQGQML